MLQDPLICSSFLSWGSWSSRTSWNPMGMSLMRFAISSLMASGLILSTLMGLTTKAFGNNPRANWKKLARSSLDIRIMFSLVTLSYKLLVMFVVQVGHSYHGGSEEGPQVGRKAFELFAESNWYWSGARQEQEGRLENFCQWNWATDDHMAGQILPLRGSR